jgi:hypothetical protein
MTIPASVAMPLLGDTEPGAAAAARLVDMLDALGLEVDMCTCDDDGSTVVRFPSRHAAEVRLRELIAEVER